MPALRTTVCLREIALSFAATPREPALSNLSLQLRFFSLRGLSEFPMFTPSGRFAAGFAVHADVAPLFAQSSVPKAKPSRPLPHKYSVKWTAAAVLGILTLT